MNANDDGNAQWLKQPQYCIDVVDLGGLNTALFYFSYQKTLAHTNAFINLFILRFLVTFLLFLTNNPVLLFSIIQYHRYPKHSHMS